MSSVEAVTTRFLVTLTITIEAIRGASTLVVWPPNGIMTGVCRVNDRLMHDRFEAGTSNLYEFTSSTPNPKSSTRLTQMTWGHMSMTAIMKAFTATHNMPKRQTRFPFVAAYSLFFRLQNFCSAPIWEARLSLYTIYVTFLEGMAVLVCRKLLVVAFSALLEYYLLLW